MNIDYSAIGKRIRFIRLRKEFSQEYLAESAGVSTVCVSRIERGKDVPSLKSIILFANALHVSADCLLVDNLTAKDPSGSFEYMDILFDCTPEEHAILLHSLQALKEILRSYKIS